MTDSELDFVLKELEQLTEKLEPTRQRISQLMPVMQDKEQNDSLNYSMRESDEAKLWMAETEKFMELYREVQNRWHSALKEKSIRLLRV